MSMPPPLEPKFERPEDEDHEAPRDVCGFLGKIKNLGLGDYLFAIGAGLRAFQESRQKRHDREPEERDI